MKLAVLSSGREISYESSQELKDFGEFVDSINEEERIEMFFINN